MASTHCPPWRWPASTRPYPAAVAATNSPGWWVHRIRGPACGISSIRPSIRTGPSIDRSRSQCPPPRFDRGADLGQTEALVMVAGDGVNGRDFNQVPDATLERAQPMAVVGQVATPAISRPAPLLGRPGEVAQEPSASTTSPDADRLRKAAAAAESGPARRANAG